MLNFRFLLFRGLVFVTVLTAFAGQAWADCGLAKLSVAMRDGNALLQAPADDAAQLPKLEAAHTELTEQVKFAAAQLKQNPVLCKGTPVGQAAALAERLRERIAKLRDQGRQVRLKVVTKLEGAQPEDIRDLWLGGKLIGRNDTQVLSSSASELVVEFPPSEDRIVTATVHIDGQFVSDRELERSETKRVYRLPSMSPGDHDLVLTVTGKERPKGRFLEITLAEGASQVPLKVSIEDVPYDVSRPIRLPEGEKLKLTITHPARETNNRWFRMGATLAAGTAIPKKLEPQLTESTKTYYELQPAAGTNKLQLQPVEGPKTSPLRLPMILVGLGLTAVGGGVAIVEGMKLSELNGKWQSDLEACKAQAGGCTSADQDAVLATYDEAQTAQTWTIVGASVGGAGLLLAGIGFFFVESGEKPPKDVARGLGAPGFASLQVVPHVSLTGGGASATLRW